MLDDLTQELRQPTAGAIDVLFLSAWVLVCMLGASCCFLFVLFSQSSPWQVWISRLLSFFGPGWARSTVPCASSNERKNQGMMTRQPSAGVGQKALGEMSRVIQSWVSNTSISCISFKISYRILKLKKINFKKALGADRGRFELWP